MKHATFRRLKRIARMAPCLAVALLCCGVLQAGQAPSLAGRIAKVTQVGGGPLARAQVELLAPETDNVRHRTFTNPEGKFSFHGVPPGAYEIRVKFGNQILKQIVTKRAVERQKFRLGPQPMKLPLITVRSQ